MKTIELIIVENEKGSYCFDVKFKNKIITTYKFEQDGIYCMIPKNCTVRVQSLDSVLETIKHHFKNTLESLCEESLCKMKLELKYCLQPV